MPASSTPRHRISCLDCGAAHLVKRSDAKYCPRCALIRQLTMALKKYTRAMKCRVCGEAFRPAKIGDRSFCGKCEDERSSTAAQRLAWERKCRYCARPVHPSIPVAACRGCLKSVEVDESKKLRPTRQRQVLGAMRAAQTENQQANHATLAAIAAGQPHIHRLTTEDAHA